MTSYRVTGPGTLVTGASGSPVPGCPGTVSSSLGFTSVSRRDTVFGVFATSRSTSRGKETVDVRPFRSGPGHHEVPCGVRGAHEPGIGGLSLYPDSP